MGLLALAESAQQPAGGWVPRSVVPVEVERTSGSVQATAGVAAVAGKWKYSLGDGCGLVRLLQHFGHEDDGQRRNHGDTD